MYDYDVSDYSRSLRIHNLVRNDRSELLGAVHFLPSQPGSCLAIQPPRTTPFFTSPFIQLLLDDQAQAFLVMTPYPSRLFREHNPIFPPSLQVLVLTEM
jgi:hypothetical protein